MGKRHISTGTSPMDGMSNSFTNTNFQKVKRKTVHGYEGRDCNDPVS
jgi:hypothetical protein